MSDFNRQAAIALTLIIVSLMIGLLFSFFSLLKGYVVEDIDGKSQNVSRKFEDWFNTYADGYITGSELIEIAYAYGNEGLCFVIFPEEYNGLRSVFFGQPLEGWIANRRIEDYNWIPEEGVFRHNILNTGRDHDYDTWSLDFGRINNEFHSDRVNVKVNAFFRVGLIKDDSNNSVGIVARQKPRPEVGDISTHDDYDIWK